MCIFCVRTADTEDVDDDNRGEYGEEFLHHCRTVHSHHVLRIHRGRTVREGQVRGNAKQVIHGCIPLNKLFCIAMILYTRENTHTEKHPF